MPLGTKTLRVTNPNEVPSDYLFHYTSAEGLLGIISSGAIWATHHAFSNDSSEIEYGFREVARILAGAVQSELGDAGSQLSRMQASGFSFRSSADAWVSSIRHLLFSTIGGYVFCLCEHNDERSFKHGLLSQWRGYADNGGYSIRFNRQQLAEAMKSLTSTSGEIKADLARIKYGNDSNRSALDEDLKAALRLKLVKYLEAAMRGPRSSTIEDFIDLDNLSKVLDYTLNTKNEHFSEECEWRISAISPNADKVGVERYRIKNGTIIPYLELRSERPITDCIDQIIVGPHPNQNTRCESVRKLLVAHGSTAPVYPTDIPLRGL